MIFQRMRIGCFVCHAVDRGGCHLLVEDIGDHLKVYCHLLGENTHRFRPQAAVDVQILKMGTSPLFPQ